MKHLSPYLGPGRRGLILLLAFFPLAGCGGGSINRQIGRFAGDGDIGRLTRTYAPGVQSEGYEVVLPDVPTTANSRSVFSLAGLPLLDRAAQVELITFQPPVRASVDELNKQAPHIAPDHRINAVLRDSRSGTVYASVNAQVRDLDLTHTTRLLPTSFIRHLFEVNLAAISHNDKLALEIEYDIGKTPGPSPFFVMIIVAAPTL